MPEQTNVLQEQSQHRRDTGRLAEDRRVDPALRRDQPGEHAGAVLVLLHPQGVRHLPCGPGAQVWQVLRWAKDPDRDAASERPRHDFPRFPYRCRCRHVRRLHVPVRDLGDPIDAGHADGHVLGFHHHGDGRLRGHVPGDDAGQVRRHRVLPRRRSLHRPRCADHYQQLRHVLLEGPSHARPPFPRLHDRAGSGQRDARPNVVGPRTLARKDYSDGIPHTAYCEQM